MLVAEIHHPPRKLFCELNILPNEGFLLGWAPGSLVLSKSFKSPQLHSDEVSALKITLAYTVYPIYLAHPLFACAYLQQQRQSGHTQTPSLETV